MIFPQNQKDAPIITIKRKIKWKEIQVFLGIFFNLRLRKNLAFVENVGSVRKTLTFHRKVRIINREKVKNLIVLKK